MGNFHRSRVTLRHASRFTVPSHSDFSIDGVSLGDTERGCHFSRLLPNL